MVGLRLLSFCAVFVCCWARSLVPSEIITAIDGIPVTSRFNTQIISRTTPLAAQLSDVFSGNVIYRHFFPAADFPAGKAPILAPTLTVDCNFGGCTRVTHVRLEVRVGAPCAGAPLPTELATATGSDLRAFFILPTPVDQISHESAYLRVCIAVDNVFIQTNLYYGVFLPCDGDSTFKSSNVATDPLLDNTLRCDKQATEALKLGPRPALGESGLLSDFVSPNFMERVGRTVCCGMRDQVVDLVDKTKLVPKTYGICINPTLKSCCGTVTNTTAKLSGAATETSYVGGIGKPYATASEKCCFKGYQGYEQAYGQTPMVGAVVGVALGVTRDRLSPLAPLIQKYSEDCPCQTGKLNAHCNSQLPLDGTTNKCCIPSKFTNLLSSAQVQSKWGSCYDGDLRKCCDTGEVYNPGTLQCCKINGLVNLDDRCSCGAHTDCASSQTCCQQTYPKLNVIAGKCSKYLNYEDPVTAAGANTVCLGKCISAYQVCCNGVACIDSYELCCNNTCCNRFSQRCTMGIRSNTNSVNPLNYRIPFETCTELEALTPDRAVLAYFIPVILSLATIASLAITLWFGKRMNALYSLSSYEKGLFVLSLVVILFAFPTYFSPLWKYGVVVIFSAFFTIVAALSHLKPLTVATIIVQAIVLIYLVDPFFGNEVLTLASARFAPSENEVHTFQGILHAVTAQWGVEGKRADRCIQYYDFFRRADSSAGAGLQPGEFMTEDISRFDNGEKVAFGFCSRGWVIALLIFESITVLSYIVLFVLTIITHLKYILEKKASNEVGVYEFETAPAAVNW